MDGKAEGRWLCTSPCDNERTIALRKNTLRAYGEVFGADTTVPAVASLHNSIELGRFCLVPKRDILALRRPESTILLLMVWDTS